MPHPFKSMKIDEAIAYMEEQPPKSLLLLGGEFCTERPDLLQTPHFQNFLWAHLSEDLRVQIQKLHKISSPVELLLCSLPQSLPFIYDVLRDDKQANVDRVHAIQLLSKARYDVDRSIFAEFAADSDCALQAVAKRVYRQERIKTPGTVKIVPCSQSWSDMHPIEGSDNQRQCKKCDDTVTLAHSPTEVEDMVGKGCVMYAPSSQEAIKEIVSEPQTLKSNVASNDLDFDDIEEPKSKLPALGGYILPPKPRIPMGEGKPPRTPTPGGVPIYEPPAKRNNIRIIFAILGTLFGVLLGLIIWFS